MEHIIDGVRALTHRRGAEIRLALFIVIGAIKALLPEDHRAELAESLPFELSMLLLGPSAPDDPGAFEELGLIDVRTVEIVCRLLADEASPNMEALLVRYVAPRLCAQLLGSRSASDSVGLDALGPTTVPSRELTPSEWS